jgi:Fic family protein
MGERMNFDPLVPFDSLPPLPPPRALETADVLRACIDARVALQELRTAGELIPNQDVLINTIPLLESQASSEIENIVTTTDALFQHARLERADPDPSTKEALRYRTALREGFAAMKARPLTIELAIRLCSRVKGVDMEIRRVPGTSLHNTRTQEVIYTPPVGEPLLRTLLHNWEQFIHDTTPPMDPLVRMAVAHYQFEAIHPFTDGNGRTGRILNLLILIELGLLDVPVLYLSRYILEHRARYYDGLLRVTTHGEWIPWILFMLTAVTDTARWTTMKIRSIRALHRDTRNYISTTLPRLYSRELVDALFQQPYCRIDNLVEAGIAKRQTVSVYLRHLEAHKVLQRIKIGREVLFLNVRFLETLQRESHRPFPR